jgi:hypothetical protein
MKKMTPAVPAPTMRAPAPRVISEMSRAISPVCRVAKTMSPIDFAMNVSCSPSVARPSTPRLTTRPGKPKVRLSPAVACAN